MKNFILPLLLLACTPGHVSATQPLDKYFDYDATLALVDAYADSHPDIVKKVVYGHSVGGRQLYAVKISDNVAVDEAEPEVSIDGCTHGEEVISAEIAVRLMIDLIEGYDSDVEIAELVDSREIWIYPFLNPDGRQLVRRANDNGVDLNRDYGYMWDGGGGSLYPFSQPETRAAQRWVDDHHFVFSFHYHAGLNAVLFPWGYKSEPPPDHDAFVHLAELYRLTAGDLVQQSGQAHTTMYPTKGTFYDYVYGSRGTLAWLSEIYWQKYPQPDQIGWLYAQHREATLAVLRRAGDGLGGTVRSAADGRPLPAVVWVGGQDGELWPVYADPEVGDFQKYLAPGSYRVRIEANGFQPRVYQTVEIPAAGATRLDVSLTPLDQAPLYGRRVEMSRMPYFNDADENMTPWALHAPDGRRYSLDRNGWIVLDLGETVNAPSGAELLIVEDDADPESYRVQVSPDLFGPYLGVGSGTGSQSFDLGEVEIGQFRYVRINDDGDDSSDTADAGFDLDAVAVYPQRPSGAPPPDAYHYPNWLTPDTADNRRYGYHYAGVDDHPDDVRFLFEAGGDLELSLYAYFSPGNRLDLWLNRQTLGRLDSGVINRFAIPAASLRAGVNELAVTRNGSAYAWGVSDLLLASADTSAPEPVVTEVVLNPQTLSLTIGEQHALDWQLLPPEAVDRRAEWSSANPSVATVDDTGLVRAVGPGQTIIELYSPGSGLGATTAVSVATGTTDSSDDGDGGQPPAAGQHCQADELPLAVGSPDANAYGSDNSGFTPIGSALALRFEVSDPQRPLLFSLRGYDSDVEREIEVLLNDTPLGHLSWAYPAHNNAWAGVDAFALPAKLLVPGCNRLVVRQALNPGWVWAVKDLSLRFDDPASGGG